MEGLMLKMKLQHRPSDMKTPLIGRDPDSGKDCGKKEIDESIRWHNLLKRLEFEETT